MFCINCGADNRDEAVYCQKCGKKIEADEEETRVAVKLRKTGDKPESDEPESDERQIFKISPTLLFVKIGYALAVVGAFLLVALLAMLGISALISIPIGIALLLIPAFYHFKQKMVRYTLTDSKVEIDSGFVFQNTRNIPLRSIQDVSVTSTVPQRMIGIGNLIIENANESDAPIILKNINSPKKYADALLKQMRLLK